jgi:transposase
MFEEKVAEIVGLYLDPPDRAVVLCVDEKSQIQAPDRTQPGLPLKKARAATMTHDDKRHGTTTLFAALDVKSGLVIGDCRPRHQSREFLRFPRRIDRAVKKPRDIHIVLDNHATHKTSEVQAWLGKHPRFKLHRTPTSASWMNLVERFFGPRSPQNASDSGAIPASTNPRARSTTTCCSAAQSRSPSSGARPPKTSLPASAARLMPSMKSGETVSKCQTRNAGKAVVTQLAGEAAFLLGWDILLIH